LLTILRITFSGDLKIRDQLLKELDEQYHPVFTTKTGALKNKGLSTLAQGEFLRGRMGCVIQPQAMCIADTNDIAERIKIGQT
jgi:hypothetical protein